MQNQESNPEIFVEVKPISEELPPKAKLEKKYSRSYLSAPKKFYYIANLNQEGKITNLFPEKVFSIPHGSEVQF